MARKVLILTASPRAGGNTQTMAGWVADGATGAGADVETIDVTKLNSATNGCIACFRCAKSEEFECAVDGEITPVLRKINDVDAVVFATPVYFFGPTAQMKLLLDRMLCLFKFQPDGSVRTKGEKIAIGVISSGGGEKTDGLDLVEATFKNLEGFLASSVTSVLLPKAPDEPGELAKDDQTKSKCVAFGEALASA